MIIVGNSETNNFSTKTEGICNIDEAVAYWIGSTEVKDDAGKGNLLYRLTEKGGDLFNTQSHDNQSKANRSILKLFKEAAIQLTREVTKIS